MRRILIFGTALMLFSGCSNIGSLGNILGSVLGGQNAQQSQIEAEVQQLDASRGTLYVRTRDGQSGTILVDNRTTVVYNRQQYPVTALERGDIVRIQLQQTQNNQLYASRIDVLQSARR